MRGANAVLISMLLAAVAGCPASPDAQDGGACDHTLPTCPADVPSYAASIEPIVEDRCVTCHYAGSPIAHNDFSTYTKVYDDRGSLLGQVYGCAMPPADGGTLTVAERSTLLTWLVCGAPEH